MSGPKSSSATYSSASEAYIPPVCYLSGTLTFFLGCSVGYQHLRYPSPVSYSDRHGALSMAFCNSQKAKASESASEILHITE